MKEEHNIQVSISIYLKYKRIMHYAVPNGIHLNLKDRAASARYMKYLKSEGFRPGVADLVLLLPNGRSIYVEVKSGKGRQSDNQKEFQNKIESLGFTYLLWRSLDDVEEFLKKEEEKNEKGRNKN